MSGARRTALRRPVRRGRGPGPPAAARGGRRRAAGRPPAATAIATRRVPAGYVVAHELRTPLTSVVLASQILLSDTLDAASRRGVVADLAGEAQRLADAVEDLLVLAGLDATAHEVEPVSLQACVRAELEQAARRAPGLRVRSLLPGDVDPVTTAVGALHHLVHDVVAAAVEAAGDRGLLEATLVGLADGRVRLRVRGRARRARRGAVGDGGGPGGARRPDLVGPAPGVPRAPLRQVAIRVLAERVGASLGVEERPDCLAIAVAVPPDGPAPMRDLAAGDAPATRV